MRKNVLFRIYILVISGLIIMTGCVEEPDGSFSTHEPIFADDPPSRPDPKPEPKPEPDPSGTIIVSIRNASNGSTRVTPDICHSYFGISNANNFIGYADDWKFSTAGITDGLGSIKKIPTAGWASQVSVMPGYGYVGASFSGVFGGRLQTANVIYVRLYVDNYIKNTSGGVMGAYVKYQSPFSAIPDAREITLSASTVNLSNQGGGWAQDQITVSPHNANWSVTSNANWFGVGTFDVNAFKIYYDQNLTNAPRSATITVKVEGLRDKTITVTQSGQK